MAGKPIIEITLEDHASFIIKELANRKRPLSRTFEQLEKRIDANAKRVVEEFKDIAYDAVLSYIPIHVIDGGTLRSFVSRTNRRDKNILATIFIENQPHKPPYNFYSKETGPSLADILNTQHFVRSKNSEVVGDFKGKRKGTDTFGWIQDAHDAYIKARNKRFN